MPDEQTDSNSAYKAFVKRLTSSPPATKEEADAAKLMAEAFASLAMVEKARAEMLDAVAPETVKRMRLEHWINRFGIGTTLTGIAGTVFFLVDAQVKNHQLKEQTALVAAQKLTIDTIDGREKEAKRKEDAAKQQEDLSKQKAEIAATLEQQAIKTKQKAEEDTRVAEQNTYMANLKTTEAEERQKKAEERQKEVEQGLADRTSFSESKEKQTSALKNDLVALPEKLKSGITQQVGVDSPIARAMEVEKMPILNDPPSKDEELRLTPRVMDLFSASGTKRGIAYDVLTNGKDRANPALVQALINVTEEKRREYVKLQTDGVSADERANAAILRRGLENALVTLRDMSRSVTKKNAGNLQKLNGLADSLVGLDSGVGEEAKKFKAWLNDGVN